jgi:small subunit ribosomal protein S6
MQMYETLYIVQPLLPEEQVEALGKTFEEIVEAGQGNLVKSSCWGKRKLAYPVRKHQEGVYFHLQYEAGPKVVMELERRLRNHEEILKYLSVSLDRIAVEALAAAEKKSEERAAARAAREAERAARQKEMEAAAAKADDKTAQAEAPAAEAAKPDAQPKEAAAGAPSPTPPVADAGQPSEGDKPATDTEKAE